jgi:hypothetical protein
MPNFTVHLQLTQAATAGHFTATLLLGTADANGNVLKSTSVPVTYDVVSPIFHRGQPTASFDFVLGHSAATKSLSVDVLAPGARWTVASSVPWIAVPSGSQQDSQVAALTVDSSTLGVGTYTGKVTLENVGFTAQRFTIDVTARVSAPSFTVTTPVVLIGGADGLDPAPQPFSAALDTGANTHPWTLTLSDSQTLGWLTASAVGGTASGQQNANVSLGFDRSKVTAGTYTGTARFDAVVKGVTVSASVPVTLKLESQRLFPEYEGVALSSFPSRNTLTRSIKVTSSSGRAGVPWTAVSDQPWLSVTPSGVTGDTLTLTANSASVAKNLQHVAVVTLTSTDPAIERGEHVRVGLWVGSTDPTNVLSDPIPLSSASLAVNPVEPLAYSARWGNAIYVFNVYTGALVDTFSAAGLDSAGAVGVSGDGRLLFAGDSGSGRTFVLDAVTGAFVRSYAGTPVFEFARHGFIHARPNGHAVLITAAGDFYDLEAHTRLTPLTLNSEQRAASNDGRWVVSSNTVQVGLWEQQFRRIAQSPFTLSNVYYTPTIIANSRDIAATSSGERVFVVTSGPGIKVFQRNPTILTPFADLGTPFPEALEAAWNGRVYAGLGLVNNEPDDNLLVFDDAGNSIGTAKSGPNTGRFIGHLAFSGDLTRVVSAHVHPAANPSDSPTHYVVSFYNLPPSP